MNDGEDKPDICPLNPDYGHKFFIFKSYEVFEPATSIPAQYKIDTDGAINVNQLAVQLYQKQEYAVLGCNCSAVRKVPVL